MDFFFLPSLCPDTTPDRFLCPHSFDLRRQTFSSSRTTPPVSSTTPTPSKVATPSNSVDPPRSCFSRCHWRVQQSPSAPNRLQITSFNRTTINHSTANSVSAMHRYQCTAVCACTPRCFCSQTALKLNRWRTNSVWWDSWKLVMWPSVQSVSHE